MVNKPVLDQDISEQIDDYYARLGNAVGSERFWAYITWSLLSAGYYSPDELIDLSLNNGFSLDNPATKIRRGTKIGHGVVIKNGTVIDGESVRIGTDSVLDKAHIIGSNITIGKKNILSGLIEPSNLEIGNGNEIRDFMGNNQGQMTIGDYNRIEGVNVDNSGRQFLQIGNHNELHRGLNINASFPRGTIRIGHYNSLGRDGGGVISTSYRFSKKWWGDVLIGSYVETTRGAEILGFSLLGWPLDKANERIARGLFVGSPISELVDFFGKLRKQPFEAVPGKKMISLFGVVKVKLSCLVNTVKAKDGTRIQRSFLKDIIIQERSKVYFTIADHTFSEPLRVNLQDRAIEGLILDQAVDWADLPTEPQTDGYLAEDARFYDVKS